MKINLIGKMCVWVVDLNRHHHKFKGISALNSQEKILSLSLFFFFILVSIFFSLECIRSIYLFFFFVLMICYAT